MKLSPLKDWFGPKTLGVGIEPKTWEGVVTTVALLSLVVTVVILLNPPAR